MKIVILHSGGLDSTLAFYIAKEWGAELFPLYVYNKFLALKHKPDVSD